VIKQIAVTVEPGITSSNPDEYTIKLSEGTLTHVAIRPAPGPNWEVYIRFLHLESAIIPNDNDEWIPLERETLDFYPSFDLWQDVYTIKVQICSPQAKYSHTVQIEINLAEQKTTEQLLDAFIKEGY
jgi:hypothetical protein